MGDASHLESSDLFRGLSSDERRDLLELCNERRVEGGAVIFNEDDEGDALFIVHDGEVHLKRWITPGGVQKLVLAAERGDVFGEMSFMDGSGRSAMGEAIEDECILLELRRADFDAYAEENPAVAVKVLNNLLGIVTARLRITNELYHDAVKAELQISGAHMLNFQDLISATARIRVVLTSGRDMTGQIIQVEKSAAGHEIVIRDDQGSLIMIPYHAVLTIHFDQPPE